MTFHIQWYIQSQQTSIKYYIHNSLLWYLSIFHLLVFVMWCKMLLYGIYYVLRMYVVSWEKITAEKIIIPLHCLKSYNSYKFLNTGQALFFCTLFHYINLFHKIFRYIEASLLNMYCFVTIVHFSLKKFAIRKCSREIFY